MKDERKEITLWIDKNGDIKYKMENLNKSELYIIGMELRTIALNMRD